MPLLVLAVLSLLCLSPIVGLLAQVNGAKVFEALQDPLFMKSLGDTLKPSVAGALGSVVLAIYFARKFALYKWKGQRFQKLCVLLPYLIPNFILAMSFVLAWNPATGIINGILRFPGGLYGLGGLTFLFSVVHLPVAFLLLEEKFKRTDSSLREAARISGASSFEVLTKIEIPLITPSLLNAFSLCFALNVSAFAIPAWIGTPARVYPLTYKIYQAIQLGGADGFGDASVFALALLFFAILPFVFGNILRKKEKKFVLLSGKSSTKSMIEQSRTSFFTFQVLFWTCQTLFWILPLGTLFLSTLVPPGCLQQKGLSCLSQARFNHYSYVLTELNETRLAAHGSLVYGSMSALLINLAAVIILVALAKNKKSFAWAESITAVPLATPGAIIALGLIIVAGGRFGLNLYNTPWIVVAAFFIKHLSFAVTPLRTGLGNISSSLIEAAQISGATMSSVWTKIVLPLLKPELLGSFFLVLVPIIGELTMSVFLTSPSFRSFGTVLFDLQDYSDQASAGALALLLVALILLLNFLSRVLSRGKLGY